MKEITEQLLCEMALAASNQLHPDDLAYLFATGKSELFIRDILSAYMQRNLQLDPSHQFVGREWRKHDMTINDGNHLLAIIEGKSYIHKDAANRTRLLTGDKSIKKDFLKDVKKSEVTIKKQNGRGSQAPIFFTTILFTVEIPQKWETDYGQVTYSEYHQSHIKKLGSSDNLIKAGNEALRNFLSKHGHVHQTRLNSGRFQDMKVTVDFFATRAHMKSE